MHAPIAYREYHGTVVFLVIDGIKDMENHLAYSCIVELNALVGRSELVTALGNEWIGTTVSGLFVCIPDESNLVAHRFLSRLFDDISASGVPVRCGVTSGPLLCFRDADNELNFVGRTINIAARLAYSKDNPGCLIHDRYEAYARAVNRDNTSADVLTDSPTQIVTGKQHDGSGFTCRVLDGTQLKVLSTVDVARLHDHGPVATVSAGLVFAYDLPQFSAGDESQLSARVRGLVGALRSLLENRAALRDAILYFCPGGDGGILVVSKVRAEALGLSKDLLQRLAVESELRDASISVEARLGVHYGAVTLYVDVGGRLRPTGRTCFVADELISDVAAKEAGLVFSESLKDVISGGSDRLLADSFDELPSLTTGPAAGLIRYAPKRSAAARFSHPLVEQLFGPTSSWQPDKSA